MYSAISYTTGRCIRQYKVTILLTYRILDFIWWTFIMCAFEFVDAHVCWFPCREDNFPCVYCQYSSGIWRIAHRYIFKGKYLIELWAEAMVRKCLKHLFGEQLRYCYFIIIFTHTFMDGICQACFCWSHKKKNIETYLCIPHR